MPVRTILLAGAIEKDQMVKAFHRLGTPPGRRPIHIAVKFVATHTIAAQGYGPRARGVKRSGITRGRG